MTSKRKSFVLHKDSLEILPDLTDDQAGKLFKAIYAYQIDEEINLDQIIKMVFLPFKNQFARDNDKYIETCERRAIAGSKGGKQKVANASNCKQDIANVADSVSKNKSDSKSKVTKDIGAKAPVFNFKKELLSLGVDKDILNDWMKVRKNKNATDTESALNLLVSQINKSGLTIDEGVRFANSENWGAFKLAWYQNKSGVNHGQSQKPSKKLSAYERARAANAEYRQEQPNECEVGVGTTSGHLGGTVAKGEGGATIEHVDNEPFIDY